MSISMGGAKGIGLGGSTGGNFPPPPARVCRTTLDWLSKIIQLRPLMAPTNTTSRMVTADMAKTMNFFLSVFFMTASPTGSLYCA